MEHPWPSIHYYASADYEKYVEFQKKKSLHTSRRTIGRERMFDQVSLMVKNTHPEAKTMLCVGCRDEFEPDFFEKEGFAAVGIDLHDKGKVIACDMSKMHLHPVIGKKKFDIVIAVEVLEHCLDLAGFITGLNRVCGQGFYVTVPIREECSAWDCSVHGFMNPDITSRELSLYFTEFKTEFLVKSSKGLFFGMSKI